MLVTFFYNIKLLIFLFLSLKIVLLKGIVRENFRSCIIQMDIFLILSINLSDQTKQCSTMIQLADHKIHFHKTK